MKGTVAALAVIALAGCGQASTAKATPQHTHKTSKTTKTTSQQTAGSSTLGGTLGVIVENLPAARPLSGLSQADMVFEAPAEGGITRFLALFWHGGVQQIGPVRSTRIYFDQLAQAYDIPFAHAGGNVDALHAIGPLGIQNLDQIYGSGPYFWRSSSRVAPHNLYTSTTLLMQGVHAKGYHLAPIPRLPQGHLNQGPSAGRLSVGFSSVESVTWVYQGGFYTREEGTSPESTLAGHAIRARAVLVLVTPTSPDPDPYTPYSIKLQMTGTGSGWAAADGHVIPIVWHRAAGQPFQFFTQSNRPLQLPGNPLWLELVPSAQNFSYGS